MLINHRRNKVIDLIICVDDTHEFHRANLKMNRSHYSRLAKTMPLHITDGVQRNGSQLYFNPYVKFKECTDDNTYKYGVIHYKDLLQDLIHWHAFYTAARLQKPVLELYVSCEFGNLLEGSN